MALLMYLASKFSEGGHQIKDMQNLKWLLRLPKQAGINRHQQKRIIKVIILFSLKAQYYQFLIIKKLFDDSPDVSFTI